MTPIDVMSCAQTLIVSTFIKVFLNPRFLLAIQLRLNHLLRNSCHSILSRNELEAKSGGLFVEPADEVVLVFVFVVTLAGVAVLLAVFEHSVNELRLFMISSGASERPAVGWSDW